MNLLFYLTLSILMLPAHFFMLQYCLNRSKDWPNKKVFELTMVMWAMALVTFAIVKESHIMQIMG